MDSCLKSFADESCVADPSLYRFGWPDSVTAEELYRDSLYRKNVDPEKVTGSLENWIFLFSNPY